MILPVIYSKLLLAGHTSIIVFELNIDALNELNQKKFDNETYLPYAIADGQKHPLNLCKAWGMTSILEPNFDLYKYFHGFSTWAEIINKIEVDTKRLDEVTEIQDIDLYKLDIQGSELMALKHS